ncbi:MAG TPA: sugar ABC transporter permease [Bacilli bacterium]|nr:MAG: Lactose transport system permease protein LacF [Tenericutes bacterium ADurb.BinA124]HNZ50062.1 sugar ABC transporter permease [Bacilli bacterium]HOH17716.1 sugar ABC transporter permease [Bacilli bacterium]HPN60569.1 sugar ABC transporter permease [Bacilli bacterium]HPX84813.1 sugar ABC transporter permease [Bacilli bacterium]
MLEYKKDGWKATLALAPMLLLMSVFTFWPIINSLIMAFLEDYSFGGMASHAYARVIGGGTYNGIGFANFVQVFNEKDFWVALKNTSVMVFISVPLTVIIGLAIAVGLNATKKLQGFFQTVFFLPYVTNTIALGLVFGSVFHIEYGLINKVFGTVGLSWINHGATWWRAMLVLMVYTVWNGLAFKIIVFLSGMQSIDKQYYQAAQIDSTPRWRVFSKITVPLLSPMILYITITSFIGAFKAYSSVIAIFGTGDYGPVGNEKMMITLVGYIYDKMWESGTPFGVGSAGSLILFAIILLITFVQFRVSKKRVHY